MPPLTFNSSGLSSSPDSGRIRCVCEYDEDDGFTIQCEQCLVWQHAKCVGISKNSVPEQYFCEECNPGWHEDLHNLALRAINLDVINNTTSSSTRNIINHFSSSNVNIIESSGINQVSTSPSGRTFKRKIAMPPGVPALNEISENIISNDAQCLIESFLKNINISRLKRQQYSQDRNLINFEFQAAVIMDSSEHLALLQKNSDVREIRSRGYQKKGSTTKYGLFATEPCDPGHFVCEFIGHVQLKNLLTVKGAKEFPVSVTQSFVLYPLASIDLAVDARKFGNGIRYARRSCRPNVQIKPIIVETNIAGTCEFSLSWGLFARNVIKANSEILLPLDYQCGNSLFRYECACNAPEFCLGPLDNFTVTSHLKEPTVYHRPASPKPAQSVTTTAIAASLVESAELESLGIRRSSSAVLQESQATPTTMTRPILDTRKLTREERKLQKYIEYFEKMDHADAAKKIVTSSSNSSLGSRKGSSSSSSPRAQSSRISSPERIGGPKKNWKRLFSTSGESSSSKSAEFVPSEEQLVEVESGELAVVSTGKKRGRKPSIKPLIPISSSGPISTALVSVTPKVTEDSSLIPSSPLKPKPKPSPPKRKKMQVDVAIVDDDDSAGEEIDVGSDAFVSGNDLNVTKTTSKKNKISKEKEKIVTYKNEPETQTQTPTKTQITEMSPLIDIERSSSVISSEPVQSATAPDTPSKKKLSLSDYLKKKKVSPMGPVALSFDENEEGEISEITEGPEKYMEYSRELKELSRETGGFGFLSEPVVPGGKVEGKIREYLRHSLEELVDPSEYRRDNRTTHPRRDRESKDRNIIDRDSRDREIRDGEYRRNLQPVSAAATSSRYRDEKEREFDRIQREREFERREAERERERRERMDRDHRDIQARGENSYSYPRPYPTHNSHYNHNHNPHNTHSIYNSHNYNYNLVHNRSTSPPPPQYNTPNYRPLYRPYRPRPPPHFRNYNNNNNNSNEQTNSNIGYRPPNYRSSSNNYKKKY